MYKLINLEKQKRKVDEMIMNDNQHIHYNNKMRSASLLKVRVSYRTQLPGGGESAFETKEQNKSYAIPSKKVPSKQWIHVRRQRSE